MSTINDKLEYLAETKEEIKDAINNAGGSVTDQTTFRAYATAISELGGGNSELDAKIDYFKVGYGMDLNKLPTSNGFTKYLDLTWEYRSINATTGADDVDTMSIRTPNDSKVALTGGNVQFRIGTGYRIRWYIYDESGNYEGSIGFMTGHQTRTPDPTKLYRFQIATTDGGDIDLYDAISNVIIAYENDTYTAPIPYCDINMGANDKPTFSRNTDTLTVSFAANQNIYCTDYTGTRKMYTFSEATSFDCTSGHVLIWDLVTNTIALVTPTAARSNYTVTLLYNQYRTVYFGALKPFYDEWVLQEQIDSINERIPNALPSYYSTDDYWDNKLAEIRDATNEVNAGGAVFAFITDMHLNANRKHSLTMLKDIFAKTTVPFVAFGGDIPVAYGTANDVKSQCDVYMQYVNAIGKDRWFTAHGNHDIKSTVSSTDQTKIMFPFSTVYNVLCRPSQRIATGVQDKLYKYLDDSLNKIRYIFVDDFETMTNNVYNYISAEQLAWIKSTILDADGYSIIVFTHAPTDSAMNSYVSTNAGLHALLSQAAAKSGDFASWTGTIVANICGHNHKDQSATSDGVLCISTTCDAYYNNDTETVARVINSITEQAFDIFCIDTDAKTIKTVRCGAGNNRTWSY